MTNGRLPIVVLGAGPAGLGAAYCLARRRATFDVTVIERGGAVGGNAGSFDLCGMRVDYGSHRLHPSCAPEILSDLRRMLGEALLDRPRHGRIRMRDRWVHFPLKPADLASHLPASFMAGVARDSLVKPFRQGRGDTFAAVLEAGLGKTICRDFYFPYARKIWGVEPETLDPEQARRRVSAGSLAKMARKVLNAVPGFKGPGTGRFFYPKSGYGAISEAYGAAAVADGAQLKMLTSVAAIETTHGITRAVQAIGPAGEERLSADLVLSSIPVPQLVRLVHPAAPDDVLESVSALKYRAMILVYLVLAADQFTEYDAHYFPGADALITRLSEPKNYGLATLPERTVLCAELPCGIDDPAWQASDRQLAGMVKQALEAAHLPIRCPVVGVAIRRLSQAYPIYSVGYAQHFERIDKWIAGIDGLITFGRQGLFAHDNTHHALAMAYALDGCLRDDGYFDKARWEECRRQFREHVVED
jgi:protoporphyrinogen oxidase